MAGKKTGLSKAQIERSLQVRYDSFGSTPWRTGAEEARMRKRAEIDRMPPPPREPEKIGRNIVDCGSKKAQDLWSNNANRNLFIEQAKFIRTLTGYCGEWQYYGRPH